jgi:hypothetical protein
MEVTHIYIEAREYRHSFLNGVRYIVELEVEEDLVSATFEFVHDSRTFCVVKFHTNLYIRLYIAHFVKEAIGLFC